MPTLGDILGSARRSAAGFEKWVAAGDPELAEGARLAAARSSTSLAGFVRLAVADFSRFADEEDWAQLTRIMRADPDPGSACLAAMVRWRLAARGCADHSA
jgi:hypothetical protein